MSLSEEETARLKRNAIDAESRLYKKALLDLADAQRRIELRGRFLRELGIDPETIR